MEHQIFVEFFGRFEDKENVFLAMEYFPLGTLDKFIDDKLHEDDTRKISLQLLEGLHIMHEEGFTHRDLKPQVSICSALFAHPWDSYL
jgi:serine/threonine protein kinase